MLTYSIEFQEIYSVYLMFSKSYDHHRAVICLGTHKDSDVAVGDREGFFFQDIRTIYNSIFLILKIPLSINSD